MNTPLILVLSWTCLAQGDRVGRVSRVFVHLNYTNRRRDAGATKAPRISVKDWAERLD